jgi:hypothetical protein
MAPAAPTGLQTIAVTATAISLTWNDALGVASWTMTCSGQTLQTGLSSPSCSWANLNVNTAYVFELTAVDGSGASSAATSLVAVTGPAAPELSPTVTTSSITVTITNGGSLMLDPSYVLQYRVTGASTWSAPIAVAASSGPQTLSNLSEYTPYDLQVQSQYTSSVTGGTTVLNSLYTASTVPPGAVLPDEVLLVSENGSAGVYFFQPSNAEAISVLYYVASQEYSLGGSGADLRDDFITMPRAQATTKYAGCCLFYVSLPDSPVIVPNLCIHVAVKTRNYANQINSSDVMVWLPSLASPTVAPASAVTFGSLGAGPDQDTLFVTGTDGQFGVMWNQAPFATSYNVTLALTSAPNTVLQSHTGLLDPIYTFTGLTSGANYQVSIAPANSFGAGPSATLTYRSP